MRKIFTLCAVCLFLTVITVAQPITVVSHSSAFGNQTGVYSITLPCPDNYQQNDLLLAHISGRSGSGFGILPPAGWTKINTLVSGSNGVGTATFYKIAGASEPGSYTFNDSLSNGSVSVRLGVITVYRGVDILNPINTAAGITSSGSSAATPSITTTADSCLLVAMFSCRSGSSSWTHPAGTTEIYDTVATGSAKITIMGAYTIQSSAGFVAGLAATGGGTNTAEIVALQPDKASGIGQKNYTSSLLVLPNPANGIFTFSSGNDEVRMIEIFSVSGEMVYRAPVIRGRATFDLLPQPAGVYFYHARSENGLRIATGKIVLQY